MSPRRNDDRLPFTRRKGEGQGMLLADLMHERSRAGEREHP